MYAPKKLCFVNCGLPADQCACYRQFLDETFLPTILATEHDRIVAEKDAEIARLKLALGEILSYDRNFYDSGRPGYEAIARAALKGDGDE